jgi:hypothetical protein
MAGKGSKARPVNKPKYDTNFDKITWKQNNPKPVSVSQKKGKTTYRY